MDSMGGSLSYRMYTFGNEKRLCDLDFVKCRNVMLGSLVTWKGYTLVLGSLDVGTSRIVREAPKAPPPPHSD